MRKFVCAVTVLLFVLTAACGGGNGAAAYVENDYAHDTPESAEPDGPGGQIQAPAYDPAETEFVPAPAPTPARRTPFIPVRGVIEDFSGDAVSTVEFVESIHPNFYIPGRMCMETYAHFREIYLNATARPMTHTEFTLATQRFLTVFGDGHLSRTFFTGEWTGDWRTEEWEWETRLFQDGGFIDRFFLSRNGRLFLADENFVMTDTEVLAIGGVCVQEIFAVVDTYFGAYNYAGRQRARGRYARYQLVLQLAGAGLYLDEENLVTDLTLLQDGAESLLEVGFTPVHPTLYRLPDFEPPYPARWEIMDGDVFYISVRRLQLGPHIDEATEAIAQALADGIRKFIIDLRNTPGGNPMVGELLFNAMGATPAGQGQFMRTGWFPEQFIEMFPLQGMRYFLHMYPEDVAGREYVYVPRNPERADNPYSVFIAALTSERTFSGGTTIAVEVADSGFGIVVGEPSATSPTGYGWGQQLWLERARLQIRPHYTVYLRPDINADPLTLWPDIPVYEWEALDAALEFFREVPHG